MLEDSIAVTVARGAVVSVSLFRSHRFMRPAVSRKAGDGAVVQRNPTATTVAERLVEFGVLRKNYWRFRCGREGGGNRYRKVMCCVCEPYQIAVYSVLCLPNNAEEMS